jgi:hypothetical protein
MFTYKVELSNGVIESVTTSRGAIYAGAVACAQYHHRNPDKPRPKVANFLPVEGGTDGHSVIQYEGAE